MEQNGEPVKDTSSAEVDFFTNGALALERERLIRLIQSHGEEGRDNGVNNDSALPSRFAERIQHFASDCLEDNVVEVDETNKVFDCFCNVVTTRDLRMLIEVSEITLCLLQ